MPLGVKRFIGFFTFATAAIVETLIAAILFRLRRQIGGKTEIPGSGLRPSQE
jgi:hypothetical protein